MSEQTKKKMTVAITGGSGQLGTQVMRRLIDDRHVERIVSIDLRPPSHVSSKIEMIRADVRDPDIAQHFDGCDVLIHLAFIVTEFRQREAFNDVNIEGSKNVFTAAAQAGVGQIIYSSSVAAYGVCSGHPDPIVEDTPRKLVDNFPYSATKFRVEAYLDNFETLNSNIKVVRIRPSIMLGTHVQTALMKIFTRSLDRGLFVSYCDIPTSFVWDEDVAETIILALRNGAHGAFNVSADDPVRPVKVANATGLRLVKLSYLARTMVTTITAATAKIGYGSKIDPAWNNIDSPMLQDCTKAKKLLGWKPNHRTTIDVVSHYLKVANGKMDRRIAACMFLSALAMKIRLFNPQLDRINSVIYIKITGRGGGDFTIAAVNRRLNLTKGIPRPPTSVATLSARTFLDLVGGRDSFETAQAAGNIRIEGDRSAELFFLSLVSRFRMNSKPSSLLDRVIHLLAKWLA